MRHPGPAAYLFLCFPLESLVSFYFLYKVVNYFCQFSFYCLYLSSRAEREALLAGASRTACGKCHALGFTQCVWHQDSLLSVQHRTESTMYSSRKAQSLFQQDVQINIQYFVT